MVVLVVMHQEYIFASNIFDSLYVGLDFTARTEKG